MDCGSKTAYIIPQKTIKKTATPIRMPPPHRRIYSAGSKPDHSNHIRTASMRLLAPVVPAIWPSLATICQPMP